MLSLKCVFTTFFLISLFFFINPEASGGTISDEIMVEYFFQPNCEECEKISQFILPPLKHKYADRIVLKKYDLSNEKNFLLLISILDSQNDDSNHNVYLVLDRSYILGGYREIDQQLFKRLDILVRTEPGNDNDNKFATGIRVGGIGAKFKISTVIIAGLIDGVNPCVFSTLVFFMSLLAVAKVSGRKLLAVGCLYCLGCFITYLLLGFGLFKILQLLSGFSMFKLILNNLMILVLVVLAILSFRDAWLFASSHGDARKVVVKLPDKLKMIIHRIMRREVKRGYLFGGAFVTGVVVTLLESVCTGQVYVPTLVMLSNEAGLFSKWFSLLLLYNLMFIIPLMGVFIFMYFGISVMTAIKLTRKNLIIGKIMLGLLFIILAMLMIII